MRAQRASRSREGVREPPCATERPVNVAPPSGGPTRRAPADPDATSNSSLRRGAQRPRQCCDALPFHAGPNADIGQQPVVADFTVHPGFPQPAPPAPPQQAVACMDLMERPPCPACCDSDDVGTSDAGHVVLHCSACSKASAARRTILSVGRWTRWRPPDGGREAGDMPGNSPLRQAVIRLTRNDSFRTGGLWQPRVDARPHASARGARNCPRGGSCATARDPLSSGWG